MVTIVFDQISKNQAGQETKKSSNVNLVDLAGLYFYEYPQTTEDFCVTLVSLLTLTVV